MKIKMTEYGEGWEFSITSPDYDGVEQTVWYRTNREGNGLWANRPTTASRRRDDGKWEPVWEYQQDLGTTQFSLSSDRRRAYQQIRRAFAPEKQEA